MASFKRMQIFVVSCDEPDAQIKRVVERVPNYASELNRI